MPIMKNVQAKFQNGVSTITMVMNDFKSHKPLYSVIIETKNRKRGCVRSEHEFHFSKDAHAFILNVIQDILV